jgi:uncharacterized protein
MQHQLDCRLTLKADGDWTFRGLASVYGNKDSHGDVVESGAFTKNLREGGSTRPLLWSHDFAAPIGLARLEDSSAGLFVEAQLNAEVSKAREALALLKQGVMRGLSIGYRVIKDQFDSTRNVRRLLEVKLYEVSLVVIPANELAQVTDSRSDAEMLQACAEDWRRLRTGSTTWRM